MPGSQNITHRWLSWSAYGQRSTALAPGAYDNSGEPSPCNSTSCRVVETSSPSGGFVGPGNPVTGSEGEATTQVNTLNVGGGSGHRARLKPSKTLHAKTVSPMIWGATAGRSLHPLVHNPSEVIDMTARINRRTTVSGLINEYHRTA